MNILDNSYKFQKGCIALTPLESSEISNSRLNKFIALLKCNLKKNIDISNFKVIDMRGG